MLLYLAIESRPANPKLTRHLADLPLMAVQGISDQFRFNCRQGFDIAVLVDTAWCLQQGFELAFQ